MQILPVLGGILQMVVFVLIIWVIVRAVGKKREEAPAGDQAVSVRRLFLYGLMFVTLMLGAAGAVDVLQELVTDSADRDNSAMALGISFLLVGGAGYAGLSRYARHRLADDESERRSWGWLLYLNLALITSLIISIVSIQRLLEGILAVDDFEAATIMPAVVWGAVWALHWFWLKATYGLPGEFHLTLGSLAGLVTLATGMGRLVHVAGDEIHRAMVDGALVDRAEPSLRSAIITAAIGAAVWTWHWLARYVHAERTGLWHVFVVLIGVLGGLVTAVGSAATLAYWALVWWIGDPTETFARDHFEFVPAAIGVLVVGILTWQYHRYVLQREQAVARTEPLRTYDYVVSAAGLVSAVVGVTLALVALFEAITPEPVGNVSEVANRLILGATLLAIGAPLWWIFWSRIRGHAVTDPTSELGSAVRRIYLVGLFGVGGVVVLVGLINVLFVAVEGLLDGTFGGETVRSLRAGLSLVVTVTGVAWYHLGVFRSDRDTLLTAPAAAAPPLPPRHVVLIAPRGTTLADELATVTGASLESWYRTDEATMPDIDLDELAAEIDASEAEDMLVVVGPDGPTVVPYET